VKGFVVALSVEFLKARRSPVPWLTLLGVSLAPLMGGLFMKILLDPAWAEHFGLLTTKAQASSAGGDWPTYWGLLTQATAIGGFVLFSILIIWLFGREYSDHTVIDLLALPISRTSIVLAKFALALLWAAGLVVWLYGLGLGMGALIGLPQWSASLAWSATARLAATAALTMLLVTPLAWVASAGRGYLPPIGALFLLLFLAQVLAALGVGAYFPWSVPALVSGAAGPDAQGLGPISYVLVLLTGVLGVIGAAIWWRVADQPAGEAPLRRKRRQTNLTNDKAVPYTEW
jgi:ABC-2 type transport system permease protein